MSSTIQIRQSGASNIVSLPKTICRALGLHVGSKLELSLVENKIVLSPVIDEVSLESLLLDSPKDSFAVTDEDRSWIDAKPIGKEI